MELKLQQVHFQIFIEPARWQEMVTKVRGHGCIVVAIGKLVLYIT